VFDGLFYIDIPCLSHNGMENARTTIKKGGNIVCAGLKMECDSHRKC